jgi:methylaspartate mutase epsilon subunit
MATATGPSPAVGPSFHTFISDARRDRRLVVQPRMGFSDTGAMTAGLRATRAARATTVGTITVDSYTRTGELGAVERALRDGVALNGYPLASIDPGVTRTMLGEVGHPSFPVQVRHGSAAPTKIFEALLEAGLDATEGGPVSYCLPYSRRPLHLAVAEWAHCCRRLAARREDGANPHLESFGGCMLGQLCPPSLLIAITVLEALFFRQHGIRSVSVSFAQQTNHRQDLEGVQALRALCAELLTDVDWHVVVYAYMGVYPRTPRGAREILRAAARLAHGGGAARLIVKTTAEAHRIPTIGENVEALELAAAAAADVTPQAVPDSGIRDEARQLIHAVLSMDADVGRALVSAFARGYLDVPYCIHPDNHAATTTSMDADGWLRWADVGSLPLTPDAVSSPPLLTSAGLLRALSHVQRSYDGA